MVRPKLHKRDLRFVAGSRGLGEFVRSLLAGIPWSERAEETETLQLKAPKGGVLRLDNPNGHTRVIGEDRKDVEARLAKTARAESESAARRLLRDIRLATTEAGAALELEVEIPRRWNRRGRANLELRVPRKMRVELSASNGRVCVQGLRAGVRARSSNGGIRVEDVEGDVEVDASNAKVSCSETCGRVVARSSNGKIEIRKHRGSVDASTSNGLVHVQATYVDAEGLLLSTSNGRIVLELPEDADADLDVRVDNGIIRNHRELGRCTRRRGGRLSGTLGRGGPPVKLRASNGTISLR